MRAAAPCGSSVHVAPVPEPVPVGGGICWSVKSSEQRTQASRATGRAGASSAKAMCGTGARTCTATWTSAATAWDERGARQRRAMCRGQTSPRCERGHGLRFRRVLKGEGRTVRCDRRCRRWLLKRAWFFRCAAGCDFDVCMACVAELRRRRGRVQASGGRKRALPNPDGGAVGQGGVRESGGAATTRVRLRL